MAVIPFQPPSAMELEGRALEKIARLVKGLPHYVESQRLAAIHGPGSKEADRASQALALLQFIDQTLELIEDIAAPVLLNFHGSAAAMTVLEVQCSLTNLRMKAFAEIRCSRVFVNDFIIMLEENEVIPALFAA